MVARSRLRDQLPPKNSPLVSRSTYNAEIRDGYCCFGNDETTRIMIRASVYSVVSRNTGILEFCKQQRSSPLSYLIGHPRLGKGKLPLHPAFCTLVSRSPAYAEIRCPHLPPSSFAKLLLAGIEWHCGLGGVLGVILGAVKQQQQQQPAADGRHSSSIHRPRGYLTGFRDRDDRRSS